MGGILSPLDGLVFLEWFIREKPPIVFFSFISYSGESILPPHWELPLLGALRGVWLAKSQFLLILFNPVSDMIWASCVVSPEHDPTLMLLMVFPSVCHAFHSERDLRTIIRIVYSLWL